MSEGQYGSAFSAGSTIGTLPTWGDSFGAPSVAPSTPSFSYSTPNYGSEFLYGSDLNIPGVSYAPASSYGDTSSSTTSASNSPGLLDWAKAIGLGMSAAGDAIRAYRGEPASPSSPFQQYLAAEQEKRESDEMKKFLKELLGKKSATEPTEGVLDPTENEKIKGLYGLPTLPTIAAARQANIRMAGQGLGGTNT